MAINFSDLGGSGGSGGGAPTYTLAPTGDSFVAMEGVAGVYTVRAYKTGQNGTPTAAVNFLNSSNDSVTLGALSDWDTGNSRNYSELICRVTGSFRGFIISLNTESWISVEFNQEYSASTPLVVTSYTTSQEVTIGSTALFALLGGGGGGGNVPASFGSGGGGSGYLNQGSISAGTYSLVIGAGGPPESNGGASTFNGLTAPGGFLGADHSGGTSAAGGAGGSGGCGGADYGNPGEQLGGFGGGNGNSYTGPGGTGSGVVPGSWFGAATSGAGYGGGIYGGGGGGGYNVAGSGGGGAVAGTANSGKTGGSGGQGGLFILTGI